MRSNCPLGNRRARHARTLILLGLTMLGAGSVLGCGADEPAGPGPIDAVASLHKAGGKTIVVSNSAELVAALSPTNAGRRILVRAGTYAIEAPLTVPDGVTLQGVGVMQFGRNGLPVGFAVGTRTTLSMSANVPGDVLSLGDGVTLRGLRIEDLPGRAGNVVAVVSRNAGDRVSATIVEGEIVNPNPHGVAFAGPTGCGLVALTHNPNLGADPPPHEAAATTVRMVRSLIHSPAPGVGCSVFALNFAPHARVSVALTENVVGGTVIANGGVSRPDAVHDSKVVIESQGNLYRDDSTDPCATQHIGWSLTGGSGAPLPLPLPPTTRNALRLHSVNDRIEGVTTAITATGGRRFSATAPSTDNRIDLLLLGTNISTPACDGAPFVADLDLAGAFTFDDALFPGDGNTLRAVIRGVTGSGLRFNQYANADGPSGPLPPEIQGSGNRLEIVGSPQSFARTNRRIDPPPPAEHFTGSRR